MAIQNDDLILVNRGGVDYKAKIEDIPIPTGDVDLSEYAKLDDDQQRVVAYQYTTINPNVRLEPSGLYTDNAFIAGSVSANHLTVESITARGEETIVGGFKTISAGEFHGDGSNLTNLPGPDLSEYAKLSDNGQNITAYAFKTVNPGSYIDPSGVYAPNVNVGAGGSVTTSTLTTDTISCGTGTGSITNFKTIIATEFIGDGSKLTGVMPKDISTLPALT